MNAKSTASLQNNAASLNQLAVGEHVRITEFLGDRKTSRRLLSLGLRIGSELEILHHRGRGVVVASSGNRVALGADIADKLLISSLDTPE
ncbi:MAG TPA: ferrous iron transport protein A [Gammaproteobacteria bacterium]|nr:ferrous iron transport protein A [Gammaproteobacteria bacterium]